MPKGGDAKKYGLTTLRKEVAWKTNNRNIKAIQIIKTQEKRKSDVL